MRLFIALPMSEEARGAILAGADELRAKIPAANYSRAENLHITLAFIGESNRVDALKACIDEVCRAPFTVTVGGSGRFGDLVWAGVRVSPPLAALERRLRVSLQRAGFHIENRPFHPHITIAREAPGSLLPHVPEVTMAADRVLLMRSDRQNGRLVYTPVYERRLTDA